MLFCTAVTLVAPHSPAAADTARALLDRRSALEDGERAWKDRHQHMHMRISGRPGQRERDLDVYERRYGPNERKAIVFLRGPAEVRDVAFLAFSRNGKPADQWLYLPGLRRVRQITVSTRDEAFVGSDLTFHDLDLLTEMSTWSEADAASTLRGDEIVGDTPCHVVELHPQRDDIGYQRIVLWLGGDDLIPRQIDFHAKTAGSGSWFGFGGAANDGQPTKRVRQSRIALVGRIPVAQRVDVETPAQGSRTEIEILAVEHDQNLSDTLFTQRALESGPAAASQAP
jgi:hypothetical protein